MSLTSPRWRRVTESEFPWEREAVEYLAEHLPNQEPVRMWSTFEFISDDGHINEVDALVLTPKGLFLVEIKSRPARRLAGDAYAWTWTGGAKAIETDNPLLLTERKAKRLSSLLAARQRREGARLPYIDTLVFCSAPGLWEEQVTAPEEPRPNPADAPRGDVLEADFEVEKRLGKGATSIALQVRHADERLVLKVAVGREFSERVREEGEVLKKLHHPHIVGIRDVREMEGQTVLVLEHAGDRTLAKMLDDEGLSLEFLERFGGDLLEAVDYLEQQGIWHRDIKPANIGIAPLGRTDKLHLVLYDFSLARVPADQYRPGTPGYLDPFIALRKPPRYDLHAERFAAAVTLYQMAPAWGDGSDPIQLDCEATVDTDLMPPQVRESLAAFFSRALARDAARRFDNAEEMLRAWRQAFLVRTDTGTGPAEAPTGTPGEFALDEATMAAATLHTSIDQLGLSARAVNALERLGCSTLRDMLRTPIAQVFAMRGVGVGSRVPDDEEAAAARRFDERLRAAVEHGGFLVLTVPEKYLRRAERELARQYGVRPVSIERTLIDAMRQTAAGANVRWDVVVRADASKRESRDWQNLRALVQRALPRLTEAISSGAPPALLTYPGLLARYEQMPWLSEVALSAGRPGGLRGAWLLVAWDDPDKPVAIDGEAVPVLRSHRAHIPDGWLGNRHRAGTAA